jgi:hypothetical protein
MHVWLIMTTPTKVNVIFEKDVVSTCQQKKWLKGIFAIVFVPHEKHLHTMHGMQKYHMEDTSYDARNAKASHPTSHVLSPYMVKLPCSHIIQGGHWTPIAS